MTYNALVRDDVILLCLASERKVIGAVTCVSGSLAHNQLIIVWDQVQYTVHSTLSALGCWRLMSVFHPDCGGGVRLRGNGATSQDSFNPQTTFSNVAGRHYLYGHINQASDCLDISISSIPDGYLMRHIAHRNAHLSRRTFISSISHFIIWLPC